MLLYTKDATSYEDLRTVHGVEYETYKEAAVALGVLEDDQEAHRILQDAADMDSALHTRQLFAMLLSLGEVQNPFRLYESFLPSFTEDILYEARTVSFYSQKKQS